jgi:23S rRNA (cytidine2498-2'-O)-methyltransferase
MQLILNWKSSIILLKINLINPKVYTLNCLFLHCRIGFEKECSAEITDKANQLQIYGYSKVIDSSAFVLFFTHEPDGALALIQKLDFQSLIFIRQWFVCAGLQDNLPVNDRLTPLMVAVHALPQVKEVFVETPDTNSGKELLVLGNKFSVPFVKSLEKNHRISPDSKWRMHLLFVSTEQAYLGVSPIRNSSVWAMGIPRLRLPKSAPSRATLKLEEAWHHFIPAEKWDDLLAPGMQAVDLGAAPGGWTWQLVQRSIYVQAIDNGPMDAELMDSGLVTHIKSDGFIFEPKKPVDWLVCDIVDKPARTSSLITKWFAQAYCRYAVFNLKLPMKQRYLEVNLCHEKITSALRQKNINVQLQFKQLFHDREEVTGFIFVKK